MRISLAHPLLPLAVLVAVFFVAACSKGDSSRTPMTPDLFIKQSRSGLEMQTSANMTVWHLGSEKDWSLDQDTGKIRFTFNDGTFAEANVHIIGTYNTDDGTFLWAWDHPSIKLALRDYAILAHEWGQKNNILNFTERLIRCTEDDAWNFTAVAARLGNASGTYRGRSGSAWVYMAFGEIKLSKPSAH